jgi:hypothetical protein
MKISKYKVLLCYLSLAVTMGCNNQLSKQEELNVYNTILDQIIYDNYFKFCLRNDQTLRIDQDFSSGLIDEPSYLRIVDSLKLIRKKNGPTCKIDYVDEFGIHTKDTIFDEEIRHSIETNLKEAFFIDHFDNISLDEAFDRLTKPADLDISELKIQYMEVVAHEKSTTYGKGVGVIAISRLLFNDKFDKAIVYYEFNCGRLCGHGQLIFTEKNNGTWKIIEYKRLWDS